MARPRWFVDLIMKFFPQRFFLAKFTHPPVLGHLMEFSLFHNDDVVYLPKNEVIPIQQDIAMTDDVVLPSVVIDHFIEASNYHWVMDFCLCRQANGCADYPQAFGCLFLGEAVQKIDPELGRRVDKAEAREHMARCREAGLVQMVGRNKLDTVWLGATPGHKLLTICNCCPCCCLWRVLPHLHPRIGRNVTRMPGVSVAVTETCKGCKLCAQDVCFVDAIVMEEGQAVIDDEACRGCGRCVEMCPLDVIELTVSDDQFVESTIRRISPLVDLT
jgi:ferredoxin